MGKQTYILSYGYASYGESNTDDLQPPTITLRPWTDNGWIDNALRLALHLVERPGLPTRPNLAGAVILE